ncbi:MAG: PAS domain-containing sensor histidine kinase, partial [Campylobacterota bacterium]
TYKLFGIFAFLNIISISVFIVMVLLVVTLIKNEKRLKDLTDKYIISSTADLKGVITDVSKAFCDISQYEREELIGKPHNIIRHPDMPRDAFKDMWNTIQKGQTWQGKVKNLKKDGGYYWVYANVEPLFDKNGNIEAYAAVRLDITDSINLKEELKRSEEKDKTMLHQSKLAQMGEMISMIAHQWRQPLNAISLTTVNLKLNLELKKFDLQSKDGADKCSDYLSKALGNIEGYVKSLSDTIDDFRGFYKEDKKKVEIRLSSLVEGSLDIVLTSIENQNIKLTTDFRCRQKVNTFPNEIRQVILNLIKNAEDILLEKNIKDPYIYIRTYNDENYSYLEVSDNGGGVPQEIIENIFDPYFSTKIKKDGTGLGLYMSKTIIEDHCNGILSVYNNNDGAVFKIQLNFAA